jgi:sulfur relay (sulfurtransferase) complex TusBCD TusD component (DsrE family)
MKTLFILNDPPYGTEHCYNALRLAHTLLKKDPEAEVTVATILRTPAGTSRASPSSAPSERAVRMARLSAISER